MSLTLGRSSLVRVRLPALHGVGARASRLVELAEAGMVERVSLGNAHRLRLDRLDALAALVAGERLERLEQVAVLRLVEALLDVDGLRALPAVVRRVDATQRHARLSTLAMQLDVGAPLSVRRVRGGVGAAGGLGVGYCPRNRRSDSGFELREHRRIGKSRVAGHSLSESHRQLSNPRIPKTPASSKGHRGLVQMVGLGFLSYYRTFWLEADGAAMAEMADKLMLLDSAPAR